MNSALTIIVDVQQEQVPSSRGLYAVSGRNISINMREHLFSFLQDDLLVPDSPVRGGDKDLDFMLYKYCRLSLL